jgi:hypothetical protein
MIYKEICKHCKNICYDTCLSLKMLNKFLEQFKRQQKYFNKDKDRNKKILGNNIKLDDKV